MLNMWGWNPGMMHWGYGGSMVMILLLVVFIVGVVFLVRWARTRPGDGWYGDTTTKRTAEEILDERYAQGEITREEYKQMKRDLGEKG